MRRSLWHVAVLSLTLWACAEEQGPAGGGGGGQVDAQPGFVEDAGPIDFGPEDCLQSACEVGMRRCGVESRPQLCVNIEGCVLWADEPACDAGSYCTEGVCRSACESNCAPGEAVCAAEGLRSCAESQAGCWLLGPPEACGEGLRCEAGACVDLDTPCEDECEAADTSVCTPAGVRYCGQYDADECLDLSDVVPCADFEICEEGACVASCTDQCAVGEGRCGPNGPEICGNFNADPCLEFGPTLPCAEAERCDDGRCVPQESTCEDACALDSVRCGPNGPQHCGDYDDDPCTEWGPSTPCGRGTVCQDGACVAACPAPCIDGEARCVSGGVSTCAAREDGCLVFGPVVACGAEESCSNGVCRLECEDECQQDETLCTLEGLRRCGQYDADPCLEWSSPTPCGPLEACQAGACVAVCENECQIGDRRCTNGGYETCGNFDEDPCLEFGGRVDCGAGQACQEGACLITCEDECAQDALRCTPEGALERCGNYDADPCLEWGGRSQCALAEVCEAGACVARPAPEGVLINELYYDAPGADAPSVFVEIHGPAGQDLQGFQLVGVNGSNGQEYNKIDLVGRIPASGLYVVAHTDANEQLRAVAQLLSARADYQNGPDSLQLRFGAQVVDALAYGVFAPNEVAAGEGAPAPLAPAGKSLSRDTEHTDTDDNATDFHVADPSPGLLRACEDRCGGDEQRCSDQVVERCARVSTGCFDYVPLMDCAERGQTCSAGSCGADSCATPDKLGAPVTLSELHSNLLTFEALPVEGGGWAIAAGDPTRGMYFGLLDGDRTWTAGPSRLGGTGYNGWGTNSAAVYYPNLIRDDAQYVVTWSAFNNIGNRSVHLRRMMPNGIPIDVRDSVISNSPGFTPQVNWVGDGLRVIYNGYSRLRGITMDALGNVQDRDNFTAEHTDTREETFMSWHQEANGGLLAYVVKSLSTPPEVTLYLQKIDAQGKAVGQRKTLASAETSAGWRSVWLFPLEDGHFGIFWRAMLGDTNRTPAAYYAKIDENGLISRQVLLNNLGAQPQYVPKLWMDSVAFDGERFAVYHQREFPSLEPSHFMVQWLNIEGDDLGRSELGSAGRGQLLHHPEAGWQLFSPGAPMTVRELGCE